MSSLIEEVTLTAVTPLHKHFAVFRISFQLKHQATLPHQSFFDSGEYSSFSVFVVFEGKWGAGNRNGSRRQSGRPSSPWTSCSIARFATTRRAATLKCKFAGQLGEAVTSNLSIRDKGRSTARITCRVCLEDFQTTINFLSEPVDVYNDWIDACESAN